MNIKYCYLIYKGKQELLRSLSDDLQKFSIQLPKTSEAFSLKLEFCSPIVKVKSHDYEWLVLNRLFHSASLSPLLIQLSSGNYVQATRHMGFWTINPKTPKILVWEFNSKYATPFTQYEPPHNLKQIKNCISELKLDTIGLLFSPHGGLEVSRSKIPFSGVICFTDHCDFDTVANLKTQRAFFKKYGIKVTKGFFLNNFSNRINASWEENHQELSSWIDDGHELAYHSLSQSIKSNSESIEDFKNFKRPKDDIQVWIDHGFQPYNHSLYKGYDLSESVYAHKLKSEHIYTLWNYIDSGTATTGVINQLNTKHFTLDKYWHGVKHEGLKQGAGKLFKAIFFHYLNNDTYIFKYKQLAHAVKQLIYQKKWRSLLNIFTLSLSLLGLLLKLLILWPIKKNELFPLARYTPVLFEHYINGVRFRMFQTIELLDLKNGLSSENLDLLVKESGLCIAHTYFSVPLPYHKGKLLHNDETINKCVAHNFEYFKDLIANKKMWNCTLSDLINYLEQFKTCEFDIDSDGNIFIKNPEGLKYRTTSI
jgi:hypothetical protein